MWTNLVATLFTALVGSSVGASLISIYFEQRRHRQKQQTATKYLALRLAFQFEDFAILCADAAEDHQNAIGSDEAIGTLLGSVPLPQPLPESDAYEDLELEILDEVFDFPQRCRLANTAAVGLLDITSELDSFREQLWVSTIQFGSLALNIARKFRRRYRLKARALKYEQWDIDNFYTEQLDHLRAVAEKREEFKAQQIGKE